GFEARELGDVGRHDRDAARRERARETYEPRLVDTGRMQARHEERGAAARPGRLVHARAEGTAIGRNRDLAFLCRARVEIGDAPQRAVHVGGANHERESVDVRQRHEPPRGDHDESKQRDNGAAARHSAHGNLVSRASGKSIPMRPLVIAIDGPSGAGKGTVARAVARALGYRHVDSGGMYRAVGWKALGDGVPLDDETAVAALAERSRIEVTDERVAIEDADATRARRTQ